MKNGSGRRASCQLLVMDVDGTLTDGQIIIGRTGEVAKAFNVKDGLGISYYLPIRNIVPVIITGRESEIVSYRCNELGIREVFQGVSDKLEILNAVLQRYRLSFSNVAYIGDDINDIECMLEVKKSGGLVGAPCDADKLVIQCADYVCKAAGGRGAVREFIDWVCLDDE